MDTPLRRRDLHADPLQQFDAWYEAHAAAVTVNPDAAALATATPDAAPSVRMVLVKRAGDGFRFFTNTGSRKGRELEGNPRAAVAFHFPDARRQVRAEGPVRPATGDEADAYWDARGWESRVSAAATPQGTPVPDRAALEDAAAALRARVRGGPVPRPPAWGGYTLVPTRMEFWQHRANRMHDRFEYERDGEGWRIRRLAP